MTRNDSGEHVTAIAIDWSGAKSPKGKIWFAQASDGRLRDLKHLSTREEAIDQLIKHLKADSTAVAGLDFAFSFPMWFVHNCGCDNAIDFWQTVEREGETWLLNCQPPFWGRPGKKKPDLPRHFRRTEDAADSVSGISAKSCFQIGGAGAVGTGSIRGMPFLSRMREAGIAVWPFDSPTLPFVVEIYPRILTGPVKKSCELDRSVYLKKQWANIPETMRSRVAGSEDAFDAAISALVMDRHIAELCNLNPSDKIDRIEGKIWNPC